MARYGYLIFLSFLILASCAQVGTITGGETDTSAPKPIAEKVNPPNASVNFTGNTVEIPFDEYFTLSSPTTSIQMVPPHATVKAVMNKKTLTLSWEEELRPNTTYAIYLNKTVRDLSERNDSIMQYVFSTGSTLDSTRFSVSVVDAYTRSPIAETVVALYDPKSDSLVNFAQTDRSGKANLTYLRPGTYKIIAFQDENKDLQPQATEEVGFFADSLITIDSTTTLTTPIRQFKPTPRAELTSAEFVAPATFLLKTTVDIDDPTVAIDGIAIDSNHYYLEDETTLHVFVDPTELSSGKIALTTSSFSDTSTFRIIDAKRAGTVRIESTQKNKTFAPSQALTFRVNDLIESVDTSLIRLSNSEDSTHIPYEVSFAKNELTFEVERGATQEILFEFEKEALSTTTGTSEAFRGTITLNSAKKYGIVSLDISSYSSPIILQIVKGSDVVRELSLIPSSERVLVSELLPGDYSFNIIHDENQNGRWDTGDFTSRTLPEQIDHYSTTTKVRANWEVEVELVPTEEEE
ncbi:MAG: Ig-like domain-containing protein [Flavobacteriales bacterium]|nr:Ig-like domain-containing protein [Flavobacteriales bacterium]